jgi:putative flippase GtrA
MAHIQVMGQSREPLIARAKRFGRALVVGSGATTADLLTLTTCIRVFGMAPSFARLPALVIGSSVQFFGHRTFTFRARAGSISRQAKFFIAIEVATLALNLALYEFLLNRLRFLPPEGVSLLGTFVAFVAFAYPMHRLVTFASSPVSGGSS